MAKRWTIEFFTGMDGVFAYSGAEVGKSPQKGGGKRNQLPVSRMSWNGGVEFHLIIRDRWKHRNNSHMSELESHWSALIQE